MANRPIVAANLQGTESRMTNTGRRTLYKWTVLTQLAGMAAFLLFATAAMLAVLPLYLRSNKGVWLVEGLAQTNPVVAWPVGIVLFLLGLLAWLFVAIFVADRMNGSIEWILHRIGIGLGANWTVSDAIVPRVIPELEGWQEDIDAKMSGLMIRSALGSSQILLHEFGNHINVISLRTRKVKRQGSPENMLQLTQAIEDTDEFLDDLSKLVTGTVSELKEINVLSVIQNVPSKLFIEGARVKTPNNELQSIAPPVVNALSSILLQVMLNLIRNALDRSEDDVIIGVLVEDGQVIIRVEDYAPMDESIVEELFIFRPAPSGARAKQHFGIGLPLCRAYMQAMGGSIEYCPMNGTGRKAFEIRLPLSREQSESSFTKESIK